MEFFSWRAFRTHRQVASLAGLTPTPYQSSEQSREQGLDKSGNSLVRTMAIEVAWGWLRFQPDSDLSLWFEHRFGHGSKRLRKIGIVALARKLLIALWRYLEYGEMPAGSQLKATSALTETTCPFPRWCEPARGSCRVSTANRLLDGTAHQALALGVCSIWCLAALLSQHG